MPDLCQDMRHPYCNDSIQPKTRPSEEHSATRLELLVIGQAICEKKKNGATACKAL